MKCDCNNQNLTLDTIYAKDMSKTPDRHYVITCINCGWVYPDKVELFNDYYRIFDFKDIRTYKCKIFGHTKLRLVLGYNYNTIMGLKVDKKVENVKYACTRCGKIHGSFKNYNRLQAVKKLLKNK